MNNQMQEIFDRVATHLLTQNKKSMNELGCAYRGAGNTSCGVGCLISNQAYSFKLEGKAVAGSTVLAALRRSGWQIENTGDPVFKLLSEIQLIHDQHEVHVWKEHLHDTAKMFHLNTNVLSNFQ